MKHIKYSNNIVTYLISLGYLILAITALHLHLNIMYILAPYALLTFLCINYTHKRSVNFTKYWIGFDVGINERGHLLKFFILACSSKHKANTVRHTVVLKVNHYQTQYIVNISKLQTMIADLGYWVSLPNVDSSAVMHIPNDFNTNPIEISSHHYEYIATEYTNFRNAVINGFKQNVTTLLDQIVNQPTLPPKFKKRTSITSFLRK